MDIKIFLMIFSLISYSNSAGMLRRTPKVYNALITTDENLTPSRAFPVIQPTIHETGIAHYPYGPYNPYRIYHPPIVHLSSPFESREIPTFVQHHHHQHQGPSSYEHLSPPTGPYHQPEGSLYETNQLGSPSQYPLQQQPAQIPQPPPPPPQHPQQLGPIPQQGYPRYYPQPPQNPQIPQMESNLSDTEQKQDQLPVIPAQSNERPQQSSGPQQPPIPLNEYGLPPSLIPLHQSYQPHNPQLPPYTFSTYPLIYDQFNHYHHHHPGQDPYLPHFDYYPPHSYGIPIHRPGKNRPKNPTTSSTSPSTTVANNIDPILSSTDLGENITEVAPKLQPANNVPLNNIKNGIENKDKNIPDVPPPPLPAGAKKVQRIITL